MGICFRVRVRVRVRLGLVGRNQNWNFNVDVKTIILGRVGKDRKTDKQTDR